MPHTGQILPLASLHPGMLLAEAVRDRFGNVMLTAGTALSEAHLAALRQRGIASAMVIPDQAPATAAEVESMRRSAEERLRHLFRKTLDRPGNRRLFEMLLAYRLDGLK